MSDEQQKSSGAGKDPSKKNPAESLDFWRQKLAEESQHLAEGEQVDESDIPQLNELAQKLDQLKLNFPSFELPEEEQPESEEAFSFPSFESTTPPAEPKAKVPPQVPISKQSSTPVKPQVPVTKPVKEQASKQEKPVQAPVKQVPKVEPAAPSFQMPSFEGLADDVEEEVASEGFSFPTFESAATVSPKQEKTPSPPVSKQSSVPAKPQVPVNKAVKEQVVKQEKPVQAPVKQVPKFEPEVPSFQMPSFEVPAEELEEEVASEGFAFPSFERGETEAKPAAKPVVPAKNVVKKAEVVPVQPVKKQEQKPVVSKQEAVQAPEVPSFQMPSFEVPAEDVEEEVASEGFAFPTFESAPVEETKPAVREFQRSTTNKKSAAVEKATPEVSVESQSPGIDASLKERVRNVLQQTADPVPAFELPAADDQESGSEEGGFAFNFNAGESATEEPVSESGGGFNFGELKEKTTETAAKVEKIIQEKVPVKQARTVSESKEAAPQKTVQKAAAVKEKAAVKAPKKEAPKVEEESEEVKPVRAGVPFKVFLFMLGYSCIITLLCVHFFLENWVGNPRELESLPDIAPAIKDGQVTYNLVPEGRKLPAGHTLSLKESRQFGNVLVTAKKVTYGPVEFQHYSGDAKKTQPASEPAYKLWLEFKNVSANQTFAPLDRVLLLTKVPDKKDLTLLRSNQFLSTSSGKSDPHGHLLVYDLPISGDWSFKDHEEEFKLAPGTEKLVYIPTQPVPLDESSQNMIWRIHLRKGYNPESHNGVTTLVEVKFNTRDVVRETPEG